MAQSHTFVRRFSYRAGAAVRRPIARRACAVLLAAAALVLVACPGIALASFGLNKLHLGTLAGSEDYVFTAGDTIVPETSVDPGKYYRFVVSDSSGGIRGGTSCAPNPVGNAPSDPYTVQASDPPSGTNGWEFRLEQFTTATCTGTPAKTASQYFSVAKVTAYTDSSLTTTTTTYAPGGTAYLRVAGVSKLNASGVAGATTDWSVYWGPSLTSPVCSNTGGGDRPDGDAASNLPNTAGKWLQYPPNATATDPWNQQSKYEQAPCPALSTGNTGTWGTELSLDATHFVVLTAFQNVSIPPAPTITSAPASPSASHSPSWSFNAAGATSYECRLETGGVAVAGYDWAACSSPRTFDLSSQPDATYTFLVRGIGPGGTGPQTSSSYTLDSTAPTPPSITGSPASPGNSRSPSWSFSGGTGASNECRLVDASNNVVQDWTACSGSKSYDLSGRSDQTYTFSVRAVSGTGVRGAANSSDYALDTQAPAAPLIGASPASPGQSRSPSWTFSGEVGATFSCRLDSGSTVVSNWAPCSSGDVFSLASQADGDYTFHVTARDAAGNVSPEATSVYTLDTTAPAQPTFTAQPPATGHDTGPAWSFTDESGATFLCRVERGATVVSDWTTCTSGTPVDLSAQPDGTYTFRVEAQDAAGNIGLDASSTYTLDTTAPAAPALSPSGATTGSGRSPAWSISTGETGASFECRLELGATVVSDWASCTSPKSVDLTGAPDGAYTFRARVIDAAGNVGPDSAATYTLDTSAPAAPAIDSAPASPGKSRSPAWTFSDEPGATFRCRLDSGSTVVSDWAGCSSGQAFDLTGQPDGVYTLHVTASDAAGNTSAEATSGYTLDTTAPAAPQIDAAPPSPESNTAPQWSFSAEAGAQIECRLTGPSGFLSDWAACSSPKAYDLSAAADGTYTFSLRATDAAGNVSGTTDSTYVLDRTVPPVPDIGSRPGITGNDLHPSWAFSDSLGGVTFECRLADGAGFLLDWAACSSPQAYDLTGRPDATYTFSVRAVSGAGVRSPGTSDSYVLDTAPPAAPSVTGPASPASDRNPSWSFSGEAGATLSCRLDRGSTQVYAWATCTSPAAFDLSGQPDGVYTLTVHATDAAGNTGPGTTSTYELDTTPPAAPVITAAPHSPSSATTPAWSFGGEAGATFECRLDEGSSTVSGWSSCAGTRTYDLSAQPDGGYTFWVRAIDAAGNVGPATSSAYQLDRVPGTAQIDGGPGALGRSRQVAWSFFGEPGATFDCRLDRLGGPTLNPWAACASPAFFDLTGQPDGVFVFGVRAYDPAGNLGAPQTSTYQLDTTPPAAPTVKSGPPAVASDRSPTWSFTAEPGAALQCRIDKSGTTASDWASCSSPHTFDLAGAADGAYVVSFRAVDQAGNVGAATTRRYELDTTPPDPPQFDSKPAAGDLTPRWSFSGEAGATFDCRLTRGSEIIEKRAPCKSPVTYDISGQPPGTYTLTVRATDAAGNVSDGASDDFDVQGGTSTGTTSGAAPSPGGPSPQGPASLPPGAPAATPAGKAPGGTSGKPTGKGGGRHGVPAGGGVPAATGGAAGHGGRGSPAGGGTGSGGHRHHRANSVAAVLAQAVQRAFKAVVKNADKTVFPFSLLLVVGAFVLVQGRIDRGDPKLALAPVYADPDLEFSPPPSEA